MIIVGVVCLLAVLIEDMRVFGSTMNNVRDLKDGAREPQLPPLTMEANIERDVADEMTRVSQLKRNDLKEYNLVLRGLTKRYHKEYLAVNRLSIAIKE